MSDRLEKLLQQNALSRIEYLTFLVFECDESARELLKIKKEQLFMEEPPIMSGESIAFHDGRRAAWREIVFILERVHKLMEKGHDRQ